MRIKSGINTYPDAQQPHNLDHHNKRADSIPNHFHRHKHSSRQAFPLKRKSGPRSAQKQDENFFKKVLMQLHKEVNSEALRLQLKQKKKPHILTTHPILQSV